MPHKITNFSQVTSFTLTSLEECSEESVYAPGHIQPHGIVLLLQGNSLNILQASENVEQFFGISAEELLGQPLPSLWGHAQVQEIVRYLNQEQLNIHNIFDIKIPLKDGKIQTFRSTLHQLPDELILELEPQLTLENNHSIDFYQRLQTVILNFRSAISISDLAQTIAREVKAITGFDRVMIYRFEADDHGVVIAEEKESYLESYLGLHYPAIDIPVPARKLFDSNWVRQIPNINYTPARLIPINHPLTDTPQDLSACVLRGVSPYHIEYLQNMGVAGTLTISLIDDRRLWGLIACHHYSPRLVDYDTRKTCEFLGQFASIELVHEQERQLNVYRSQAKTIQDQIQQAFRRESSWSEQVL